MLTEAETDKTGSCGDDDDDMHWGGVDRRKVEADNIVTLQEAVADFDIALRDHRQKRRGLLGSAAAAAVATEIPTTQGGTKGAATIASFEVGRERGSPGSSPKQKLATAVDWLDGAETSWSAVDFEGEDLRDTALRDNHENRSQITTATADTNTQRDADGCQRATVTASTTEAGQPQGERISGCVNLGNVEVQDIAKTAQAAGRDAPVTPSDRVQYTGAKASHTPHQAVTPIVADQGATGGEIGAAESIEQRPGPEISPSSPLGEADSPRAETEGVMRQDASRTALNSRPAVSDSAISTTRECHGPHRDHSECDGAPPPNRSPVSPSPDGTQNSAVSGVEATLEGGIGGDGNSQSGRQKIGLNALAAPPLGCSSLSDAKTLLEPGEQASVTGRATNRSSSANEGATRTLAVAPIVSAAPIASDNNVDVEADPTITMPQSESPAVVVDHQRVTAPAVAAALESPDPVATSDQRTTSNWMQGTTSGRPPPVGAVAVAEAELAERIDHLQSKRLAAGREERESFDAERAARFQREHVERSAGFAEEDRQTLAVEEARLAELRREADLGRLQRGAEFEEADVALATLLPRGAEAEVAAPGELSSGGVAVPVRGMRPQHYREADDLPDGVKKAVQSRPADKVVDELEGLARRAKAAGGGMNLEEFENLEQRQRARQVERLEIFHGQTAEEKSSTMLKMVVRLQQFARLTLARRRVARLQAISSASKEKVR